VGKPESKRPLGRPSHRQEADIETNLTEIGWNAWNVFSLIRIVSSSGLL
jgi:hypothetical protein